MDEQIDFTRMRVGTVTRRDAEGKAVCKIARCPKCGRNGELHAGVEFPNGVSDVYDHKATNWGWARHIDESCYVARGIESA